MVSLVSYSIHSSISCFHGILLPLAMSFEVRSAEGESHRGCFALHNLPPSTLILSASPLVTAPCFTLDRRFPSHCCLCWKTLPKKFLCQKCHMEAYCESCRDSSHHLLTCHYLEKLFILQDNLDEDNDIITFTHLCINLLILHVNGLIPLDALYDLCQLSIDQLPPEQFTSLQSCIQLITQIIPKNILDNAESLVQDIFLREICNGFCFWDTSYEKYAQAIIPTASYFNHSCYPNAFKMNVDGKVLIYSLREIAEGEEISISYVPHDYDQTTRLEILSTYFGFACRCIRCQQLDDFNASQIEDVKAFEMNVVHHGCGGVYHHVMEESQSINPSRYGVCSICHSQKTLE